jgi:hypothetical protein
LAGRRQKVIGAEGGGGEVASQVGIQLQFQAVALVEQFAVLNLHVQLILNHYEQIEIVRIPGDVKMPNLVGRAAPVGGLIDVLVDGVGQRRRYRRLAR